MAVSSRFTLHASLLVAAAILAAFAFTVRTGTAANSNAHHRVTFDYRATMRASELDPLGAELVGGADMQRTSEPASVLISLAEVLVVDAHYELAGDYQDVSGTLLAELKVRARDGWERTWPLGPATVITGTSSTGTATVDVGDLDARLLGIERDADFRPGLYDVTILFTASIEGTTAAGTRVADTFVAPFEMQWTGTKVVLPTALRVESAGASAAQAAVGESSLFGISLMPGSLTGRIALFGAVLLLAGAFASWMKFRGDPRIARMRLGSDVVRASLANDPGNTRQVHAESLEAIARAAKMAALPLCYDERRNIYFALDRDVMYIWREDRRVPTTLPKRDAA